MRSLALVAVVTTACSTYAYTTAPRDPAPRSILEQHAAERRAIDEPVTSERLSALDEQPAVRHRRVATSWQDIAVVTRGGLFSAPSGPPVATAVATAVPAGSEKLVVEAWIELQADDVAATAAAVAARVEADGGRVVSSSVIGADRAATSAALELRVPPARAGAFLDWLAAAGEVQSRRTLASEVGKLMHDQELELANLRLTMSRLEKLAEKDVPVQELLEIEKEMTRVRGQIERVEGERRWLADRVELATVSLTVVRDAAALDPAPHARIYPGPRLATLTLLDPAGRPRTRLGGGASLHLRRYATVDLDVFPAAGGDSRAVIATVGTALYSGYLGFGRRRYLNPYLGARLGYGFLSGEGATVLGAELGVELVRHRYLRVEAAARAVAFFREAGTDAALHTTLGVAVPF